MDIGRKGVEGWGNGPFELKERKGQIGIGLSERRSEGDGWVLHLIHSGAGGYVAWIPPGGGGWVGVLDRKSVV